jgi:hypothetical protein
VFQAVVSRVSLFKHPVFPRTIPVTVHNLFVTIYTVLLFCSPRVFGLHNAGLCWATQVQRPEVGREDGVTSSSPFTSNMTSDNIHDAKVMEKVYSFPL